MSEEKILYNKLVRDKIPEKIKKNGGKFKTRTLNDEGMKEALEAKLQEELLEYLAAKTPEQKLSEAADIVVTLIKSLNSHGYYTRDLNQEVLDNIKAKGSFNNNIFLVWATPQ